MVPLPTINLERTEWYENPESALRIGRLVDQIKYAIAEKFAGQYHRIGLPVEYETLRRFIVPEMCDSMMKGGLSNE
jgi:hypothetical protein